VCYTVSALCVYMYPTELIFDSEFLAPSDKLNGVRTWRDPKMDHSFLFITSMKAVLRHVYSKPVGFICLNYILGTNTCCRFTSVNGAL
jgi:hypothetical protein